MMKDNGGPAFPVQRSVGGGGSSLTGNGMTLRDYFAARMMADLMSGQGPDYWKICAERAYAMADAMLEARKK